LAASTNLQLYRASFLTNTTFQHNTAAKASVLLQPVFVIGWKQLHTPGHRPGRSAGLFAAFAAISTWVTLRRSLARFLYVMLPLSVILALLLMAEGRADDTPGKRKGDNTGSGKQSLLRGRWPPREAHQAARHRGGGFFGAQLGPSVREPDAWTNILECVAITLIPWPASFSIAG